jgi:tetratricopeptide (TPR) repeat protein
VRIQLLTALLLGAVAAGCRGERLDDQPTGSIRAEDVQRARAQLPPEVRTLLDSGNAAYREGRYDEARRQYEQATRQAPDVAAGWFGLYMVEAATGNATAAEAAIRRAREAAPRASLLEDEPEPRQ